MKLLKNSFIIPRAKTTWKQGWRKINKKRFYFRSSWEYNYALYLNFLKKNKEIIKWEYEPDTFWFDKIKRGTKSYTPDFKITNNDNSIEYHEVKGWMDDRSKTKLKRMKKYYPKVVIKIIDATWFKLNKQNLSGLLGWE